MKKFNFKKYSNDNGINNLIDVVNEEDNDDINIKTLSKILRK